MRKIDPDDLQKIDPYTVTRIKKDRDKCARIKIGRTWFRVPTTVPSTMSLLCNGGGAGEGDAPERARLRQWDAEL